MLNLKNNKNLQHLKNLTWDQVFDVWRKNEDYLGSHWKPLWQARGFKSWDDWRMTYVDRFELKNLNDWGLYEIVDHMKFIPQICGGSFSSWVERYYNGEDNPLFSKIVQHPDIQPHKGIIKFIDNFPQETTISGVVLGDKIVVVEGMHRCAAVALAALQGKAISSKIKICLANHYLDKLPIAGENT